MQIEEKSNEDDVLNDEETTDAADEADVDTEGEEDCEDELNQALSKAMEEDEG